MNPEVQTLLDRWAQPDGIPFKGKLISGGGPPGSGDEGPTCMCAQGQALHYLGGYTPERLHDLAQADADCEAAKLLGISRAHAVLLRMINDSQPGAPSVVLTDPAKVLGDQAHVVLAFWRHLDRMTPAQWDAAGAAAWDAAGAAAWDAAGDAAWDAAWDAAGDAAWDAAWDAAGAAAWDAAGDAAGAGAWASSEIQGAAIMRERGQPFYFLPLFGFADPEAVLAADEAAQ